jgi:hypothetical protein
MYASLLEWSCNHAEIVFAILDIQASTESAGLAGGALRLLDAGQLGPLDALLVAPRGPLPSGAPSPNIGTVRVTLFHFCKKRTKLMPAGGVDSGPTRGRQAW